MANGEYGLGSTQHSFNLVNREKLFQDIADGLKEVGPEAHIGSICVLFHDDEQKFEFSLYYALDYLINDIYFDERGNWSNANKATVEVV